MLAFIYGFEIESREREVKSITSFFNIGYFEYFKTTDYSVYNCKKKNFSNEPHRSLSRSRQKHISRPVYIYSLLYLQANICSERACEIREKAALFASLLHIYVNKRAKIPRVFVIRIYIYNACDDHMLAARDLLTTTLVRIARAVFLPPASRILLFHSCDELYVYIYIYSDCSSFEGYT